MHVPEAVTGGLQRTTKNLIQKAAIYKLLAQQEHLR
jgi:hypothetical protein